ncbi:Lsr2 family protein [Amycolatopsis acidicola]|uniref:Lsr2 family protein n=1 Tax=Amycolatopsis acidicola TaxID=2596893 RepID=A0A5N0VIE0_9PSEU|nr:Lsr2 family protein [Amycolatopsis acidicola]KAA9166147.1 Lsr2 family protein [Amycolatopsis acidicola]
MAQKVQVDLVDDIDGSDATQTVPFTLDGAAYEIDLSDDNAAHLRDQLVPFITAGRRVGGRKIRSRGAAATSGATTADREHSRAVRTWALDNGWAVSDRGRIPLEVQNAYKAAQEKAATKAKAKSRPRSRRKK